MGYVESSLTADRDGSLLYRFNKHIDTPEQLTDYKVSLTESTQNNFHVYLYADCKNLEIFSNVKLDKLSEHDIEAMEYFSHPALLSIARMAGASWPPCAS